MTRRARHRYKARMPIRTRTDFVQLDRTFHDLKTEADGSDEVEMRRMFGGKVTGWRELEADHRVVLLAEAGAGKTKEIRQAALSLRERGCAAFFMRIEHVVHDFDDAFEVGDAREFGDWLASSDEGWMFLDSIDEARLGDVKDFERAMRKVARHLAAAMQRTHLVVAGRATAWRPATDLNLCTALFPYSPQAAPKAASDDEADGSDFGDWLAGSEPAAKTSRPVVSSPFRVVALDDLSRRQIRSFLQARNVDDVDGFLDAVERADADVFTARPQDLEELAAFWAKEKRIGSRLEIMRASIDRRLTERDQDRSDAQPLTPQRAREGARLLAAATTLTGQPLVRVPDGAQAGDGLPVRDVLTGWTDAECAVLLARPVFDEAIYGAVRFHHRSVREYLAAEWLSTLLQPQGSRRRVEQLFFKEQYGLQVVVPALRPLLPWLVLLDQRILERTLALAPSIVFEAGDPRQLPAATRRRVLREVCNEIAMPAHGRSSADYAAVQRFAGPDIADQIRELLQAHAANDDVVHFLMRMIWHGEIGALAPEAKETALAAREKYARLAAFKALAATGVPADMEEARASLLVEPDDIRRSWLAELIETLPREPTAVNWLLAALAKVKPKKQHGVDRMAEPLGAYVDVMPVDLAATLATGIAQLLVEPPMIEQSKSLISQRHRWLAPYAARAIARLIEAHHPTALEPETLSMLRRLSLADAAHNIGVEGAFKDLARLVRLWPELNQRLFWLSIKEARAERKPEEGPLTDYWPASIFGTYWGFGDGDFDLIAADIADQPLADDRLVALTLAFQLYRQNGRPRSWRERLKRIASNEEALVAKLNDLLRPPAGGRTKWRRDHNRWEQQGKARRLREETNEHAWRQRLRADYRHLRATAGGVLTYDHHHLLNRMRSARKANERWSEGDWRSLAGEFGDEVALAFRDGAVAAWRRTTPPLVSEGALVNTTPFSSILGLAGLAIEARETERWAERLSAADAELATRYALEELNGFPPWLTAVYGAHPNTMLDVVLREVAHELATDTGERESWYLLYDASWAGQWMWDRLAPALMPMFDPEPRSDGNLRYMLTIVQGSEITDAEIAVLAAAKTASSKDPERAAVWAATWTGVDPVAAIPAFSERLSNVADATIRTRAAMRFLTALLGTRRHGGNARQAFRTVGHLKALYLLAHEHIRQEDDIHRGGTGVYSPGLRDDAQDARSAIFSLLNEIRGKEAFLALMDLSQLHPDDSSRPWMTFHAKEKAAADADAGPWTIPQVRQFAQALERTPSNHRELWELAVDRLLDLKHELEDGDGSMARLLLRVEGEGELRNFIGNWCRDRAAGRYSIPQEEELADAKRPDLRFHGAGFDAPVPVELKIAGKWTGPQLFERLENQLCGDYLRDLRSGRGVYLLVHRGDRRSWELPGGGRADSFPALVTALQTYWTATADRFPGVDDVKVVGIDLTRRNAATRHPSLSDPN